jgi:opacity protein-like surface antigen
MKRTLLAAAAFLVFSTAAFAQVEQPSQISIQGTALITKDTTSDSTSTLNRATKSGGFLLGYQYQFNHWAGVEGNYGYTRNTQNYFGSFGQSAVEANTHELTGSFVFHIPLKAANVRPYALAGGGALIFDPTDKFLVGGVDRQTKGTFVYGGGFDVDVARNFGIRTEYRGLVYKTPDFKLNTLTLDKVTHLAQPSIGFYFRF